MENKESKEPRDRILNSAAALFASKGYSAVGVREIASASDVNISMISYYFGGKIGILKAIIEKYYSMMQEIFKEVNAMNLPHDEHTRLFIKKLVNIIRNDTNLCKVALMEMALEEPEVESFKVEMIKQHIEFLRGSLSNPMCSLPGIKYHSIMGPALMSLIYSNFLIGNLSNKIVDIEFNDEFYDFYSDVIADVFLYGITGLSEKLKKTQYEINSNKEII
jgi:AcrR family transcriptional regulator